MNPTSLVVGLAADLMSAWAMSFQLLVHIGPGRCLGGTPRSMQDVSSDSLQTHLSNERYCAWRPVRSCVSSTLRTLHITSINSTRELTAVSHGFPLMSCDRFRYKRDLTIIHVSGHGAWKGGISILKLGETNFGRQRVNSQRPGKINLV